MNRRDSDSKGFTRTDLLAVIAVVGVLSLLTPSLLGSGRQHGQAAGCLDHFRRLAMGCVMYAADNHDLFPPNPDDGNTVPGHNWCPGQAGRGGSAEFNPDLLADAERSLLVKYVQGDVGVFLCPADLRQGRYQGTDPDRLGMRVPAARSIAMNHAVGTVCPTYPAGHNGAPVLPTHGPWLDNNHSHTRDGPFRTYGSVNDLLEPGPSMTWVFIDEDAESLNDGGFAFGMWKAEWIDWPGTRHDLGATLAYADGHAEVHRWTDSRTVVVSGNVARRPVPDSEDYAWLRERTSAPKQEP